jgi:hypothetical protein
MLTVHFVFLRQWGEAAVYMEDSGLTGQHHVVTSDSSTDNESALKSADGASVSFFSSIPPL